ncbi:hypothetical protein [Promicromonospora sp. NPDC057488]|uniref:hypothetical protein n=1 Tax=Promicromonospora sp. NPDC057488 TaxID=3346147 RepID=UPI0036712F82
MNPHSPHSQHNRGPRTQPVPPTTPAKLPGTDAHAFDARARRKTTRAEAPILSPRGREVMWVRSGDLPSLVTRKVLVRGVDLHAAIVRRALRRPTVAAKNTIKAAKRVLTPGGRRQEPTAPQHGSERTGI